MGIAIIGGGPVGLWTAAQIKIQRPDANVTVFEKHPFYQRTHPLVISHSSLGGTPNDPRLIEFIEGFKASKPHGIFWKTSTISTKKIETDLESLAKRVGVKIEKNTPITDCTKLQNIRIIIGADGAHSHVRKMIFDEQGSLRKQLNRVIEIKYFVKGQTQKLSFIKDSYPSMKSGNSLVEEHVGSPNEEGLTPVSLRFFVSRKDYELLQEATFKNPYKLAQLPKSLEKKVKERLALRAEKLKEIRVVNSEKVTATPLGTYSSSSFVKKLNQVTYCLVGDAAFGVPFFRSGNNGFLCGTKLAKYISAGLANPKKMSSALFYYNCYVHVLSKWEICIAVIKSLFIKIAELFIYINSKLPWQFIKPTPAPSPTFA